MKDTFYFPHDYNARNDQKIKILIEKYGMKGYGIFWSLVEELYNNDNKLLLNYEILAYDLRSEPEIIKAVINNFGLFKVKPTYFSSISVGRRLLERQEKSEKAREAVSYRWTNNKRNTDVIQPQYNSNTIKERNKGKERKETNVSDFNSNEEKLVYKPGNVLTIENLTSNG